MGAVIPGMQGVLSHSGKTFYRSCNIVYYVSTNLLNNDPKNEIGPHIKQKWTTF